MKLIKIEKNHYQCTYSDSKYIEFELDGFATDKAIELAELPHMSEDNVIFLRSNDYPTPEDDFEPVLGTAYLYEGKTCIDHTLVSARIINTDLPMKDAKHRLEFLFI